MYLFDFNPRLRSCLSNSSQMPCKTAVFSGDSVFLTAFNFRQCAGRTGCRCFDILGNIAFHGISQDKACRLLSSRLPDLNGHFPMTTNLVLRLLERGRKWEYAQWPKKKKRGKNLKPKPAVREGSVYFFACPLSFPVFRLRPVYINASPLTTDLNMTASSFSILLLPALLLTAIHLPACWLTYMADRLGNQVDMSILSTAEAHPAELVTFGLDL